MAARFSLKALQEKCGFLERHVRYRDLATDDELADYRPGGQENKNRGTGGWVFYYAQLVRFCGRSELPDDAHHEADAQVLDALRAEPVAVELLSARAEGKPRVLEIHPKGLGALMVCHARDWILGWLGAKVQALKTSDAPNHLALIDRALEEIAHQYALLAWVASHPGSGLPWEPAEIDAESGTAPEPPRWLLDLDPIDFPRIAEAFAVVNAQRLQALERLISATPDDDISERPSWSVFVGSLAIKMNLKPRALMYDVSLGELLAAIRTHGHAEKTAHDAAERRAKRETQAAGSVRGTR